VSLLRIAIRTILPKFMARNPFGNLLS